MADKVLVENRGAVRILRINRPEVRNCVDGETAVGLGDGIEAFALDPSARVLVVTGSGGVSFCAGADLKDPASLFQHRHLDSAGPMGFARLDPGKPTIAAINGFCFAGGFELAAWCDFRIAASNAEFGCLSRRWGVPYLDGGTQRFARIMGVGNALYLLETGARIDAQRAMALGEFRAVRSMDQRNVRHHRHIPAKRIVDLLLARAVRQMVVAADDVGDTHVVVVDDH